MALAGAAVAAGDTGLVTQLAHPYGTALLLLYATAVYLHARSPLALPEPERAEAADPAAINDPSRPPLLALVPSYEEEEKVVAQAVLSATRMDDPRRRVVLLVDDPPFPAEETDRARLRRPLRLDSHGRPLHRPHPSRTGPGPP